MKRQTEKELIDTLTEYGLRVEVNRVGGANTYTIKAPLPRRKVLMFCEHLDTLEAFTFGVTVGMIKLKQ